MPAGLGVTHMAVKGAGIRRPACICDAFCTDLHAERLPLIEQCGPEPSPIAGLSVVHHVKTWLEEVPGVCCAQ